MKDYLGYENARNKRNAALYERLMKRAVGGDKPVAVLIGHHLTFEIGGDLSTENEIPSADCLLFDHEFMGKVFGDQAVVVMRELASVPAESRDTVAQHWLEAEEEAEAQAGRAFAMTD